MNKAMVAALVILVMPLSPVGAQEVEERAAVPAEAPADQAGTAVTRKVYKSYRPDGSVVFTDEPVDGGQEIEIRESNSLRFKRVTLPEEAPDLLIKQEEVDYSVAISAPADQSHFHNHPDPIPVQVSVTPAAGDEYRIEVLDNGEPINAGEQGAFEVDHLIRGEHHLEARLVDRESGDIVAEATPVTIYIHRVSALTNPANKPKPKPGK